MEEMPQKIQVTVNSPTQEILKSKNLKEIQSSPLTTERGLVDAGTHPTSISTPSFIFHALVREVDGWLSALFKR